MFVKVSTTGDVLIKYGCLKVVLPVHAVAGEHHVGHLCLTSRDVLADMSVRPLQTLDAPFDLVSSARTSQVRRYSPVAP